MGRIVRLISYAEKTAALEEVSVQFRTLLSRGGNKDDDLAASCISLSLLLCGCLAD
jgi:hypothetical protein